MSSILLLQENNHALNLTLEHVLCTLFSGLNGRKIPMCAVYVIHTENVVDVRLLSELLQ